MTLRTFLSRSPRPRDIWAYLSAACLFWLLILNRWVVTSIGLKSYGRVWQNQISYGELGFIKRTLWGTFLTITGLNKVPANEYVNAYLIHGVVLALISAFITIYIFRNANRLSNAHAVLIYSSPAFLSFLAYSLGTLDVVVSLFLVYSSLFVRSYWRLGIIAIIGLLVHESYFFFVPFIAINNVLMTSPHMAASWRSILKQVFPTLLLPLIALIALKLFDPAIPDWRTFEPFMRAKLPNAAYQCPYWSGYFELYSPLSENLKLIYGDLPLITDKLYISTIPILYLVGLVVYLSRSRSIISVRIKTVYVITALGPLAISLVANDYLRWINLSSILCVLAILNSQVAGTIKGDPWKLARLIPFALFGPFGRAIDYSMPIHQFFLERILR